jgi:hypothetical protein
MFTFERFAQAFSSAEEREAFFRNAHRGVKPGTAMTHVLASNVGIWGNVDELKRDAAEIMSYELDAYANARGEQRLSLPAEAIASSPAFSKAFAACRRFNAEEVEQAVTKLRAEANPGMDFPPPPQRLVAEKDPAIASFRSEGFVADLYHALCSVADAYADEMEHHRRRLSSIGAKGR